MPRLIDDIRAAGRFQAPGFIAPRLYEDWSAYAKHIWSFVENAELTVLHIDNVADYYYKDDQEFWDLSKHFPNLAPPFEASWFEHKLPTRIHSKEKGDTDMGALLGRSARAGVLLVALAPKDCKGEAIPENAKWIVWGDIFISYGDGRLPDGPHGATFFAIDQDGALIGTPWMQTYCSSADSELMKSLITWYHPTMLAISFLHCKNVKMQDEAVDKPLAKKYHARTGVWPTKFRTLIIEPLKQILRTQGRSDTVGVKHALHICRGHFADYTEGRGLFGKLHGRFWIPATVRGTQRGKEKTPPAREIEVKL